MSGARISRTFLPDDSLNRAVRAMLSSLSMLGAVAHAHRDDNEVAYALKQDDDALCDVLGILLNEQLHREIEDADMEAQR